MFSSKLYLAALTLLATGDTVNNPEIFKQYVKILRRLADQVLDSVRGEALENMLDGFEFNVELIEDASDEHLTRNMLYVMIRYSEYYLYKDTVVKRGTEYSDRWKSLLRRFDDRMLKLVVVANLQTSSRLWPSPLPIVYQRDPNPPEWLKQLNKPPQISTETP